MKSRSRECLTNPCSEFLLSETSYDCVEECQELLNRISLDGHNERRRRHVDTPDLVYDPSLCADAQRHADLLASTETFEHDQSLGQKGLGENLYQVTPIRRNENGVWYNVPSKADEHYENAVKNWYNERTRYFYQMAMFTPMTGHFTQIVWKSTTAVCMAHAYSDADNLYIVARYSEGGNIAGQFRENVLPLKSNEAYSQDECKRIPASVLTPHLPVPWSCEEFIQCDEQRVPFIKTCAPGTAWRAYVNSVDGTCDFPANSNCVVETDPGNGKLYEGYRPRSYEPTTTTTTTTTATTTTTTTPTTSTTTTSTTTTTIITTTTTTTTTITTTTTTSTTSTTTSTTTKTSTRTTETTTSKSATTITTTAATSTTSTTSTSTKSNPTITTTSKTPATATTTTKTRASSTVMTTSSEQIIDEAQRIMAAAVDIATNVPTTTTASTTSTTNKITTTTTSTSSTTTTTAKTTTTKISPSTTSTSTTTRTTTTTSTTTTTTKTTTTTINTTTTRTTTTKSTTTTTTTTEKTLPTKCTCISSRGDRIQEGRIEEIQITKACSQVIICRQSCEIQELTPICDTMELVSNAVIKGQARTTPETPRPTIPTTRTTTTSTTKATTSSRVTATSQESLLPWFWNMNPFKSTTQRPTTTTTSTRAPPTIITTRATTQGSLGWLWNMNPFRPTTQRTTSTTRASPTACTCSSNGRNLKENESAIFEMSANCRQTRTCGSGCILRTSTPICNVQPSPNNSYVNRVNNNCQCGWKGQQFSGIIPSDKVCYWLRCTSYLGYCQAQTVVSCVHPDTKKIGPYWPDKNRPAPTEHPSWSAWEVAFVNGEPMRQREEVGQPVQAVNPYKQQREDCSVWRGCLPRPECMSNYVRCIGTN